MNFQNQFNSAGKFARDNSPAILTGISIVGVITTAILTARATYKTALIVAEIEKDEINETGKLSVENNAERTKKIVKASWPLYVAPAFTGSVTVGCILGSNKISANRTAAAVAAYAISEKAFGDYRGKAVEMFNANKEERLRAAVMQDKVLGTPVPSELTELAKADKARVTKGAESKQIIILDKKHVRCFEGWTGRYFLADKDSLDKAVNMVNARIIKETPGYCSLSTFYDYMDLEHTQMSDYYGWNFDKMLELQFYTVMSYDDEPCLAFDYKYDPTKL